MADPSQAQTSGLVIPPEVQEKFGALIELIKGSESMNNEERQYWINILPVMTPEQIKNLEEILSNEKQQLAAIDAKYSKDAATGNPANTVAIEEKIRASKQKRETKEREESEKEAVTEEELLGKIQSM